MKKIITSFLLLAGLATAVSSCKDDGKDDPQPKTTMILSGNMNSANALPVVSVASTGTGAVSGTYDTKTMVLTYTVTYSGLTSAATVGHFHLGDATTVSSPANIIISFPSTASPITGTATLTPSQAEELLKGNVYANIHTASNRAGEIRASVVVK